MVALEMFSQPEHLRTVVPFVSICLGNGLPAASLGTPKVLCNSSVVGGE